MPRTVSVAMIVKDESEYLAECLKQLAGVADEFCIVDTGSEDNTIEIARQLNAKTSFYIWCDDFAAARNESLRICTKEWVFVVDADERVAAEDVARIRALTEGPRNVGYRFLTRNYTNVESTGEFRRCAPDDPHARGFAGWYPSTKVRLFPNNAGARFEGKIHELVHESLERRGVRILDCDIPIHHYAYARSPKRILEKQRMYLALGHKKIEAQPNDPKAYAELGNQYADAKDYASAAAAYREALRIEPANAPVLKDLGGALHMLKRSEEAKRALRLALHFDPGLAEAWRNLGVIFADQKEWALSTECFQEGLRLDPAWSDGRRYLSVALEGEGRLAEAAQAARQALELNPRSSEALRLYVHQMLRLERRAEAREFMENLLRSADVPEVHNVLGELYYYDELFEESKAHFLEAGRQGIAAAYNNLGVVLYRQKRFKQAHDAFERCLEADPGHHGAFTNLQKTLKRLENGD